jgi:hypothetical protein
MRGWLRYHENLVPVVQNPIPKMGTILHLHQAFYWCSRMVAHGIKPPDWFYSFDLKEAIAKEAEGYPELITRAEACIDSFRERFKTDQWVPVAVEREFMVPLEVIKPNCKPHLRGEVATVRTDLVVETPKGWKLPVDYKSLANAWQGGLPRWDPDGKFQVDWQVGMNIFLIQLAEPTWKVDTMIIQRILQVPPFLADRNPVRLPFPFRPDLPDLIELAIEEEIEVANGPKPPLKTGFMRDACYSGWSYTDERYVQGRPCEYRDLCLAETEKERESLIQKNFRKRS